VDEFQLLIFKKAPGCGWMLDIFKLRGLQENMIQNAWDCLTLFVGYLHMLMSLSCLRLDGFIEYNHFLCYIQWPMTLSKDNEVIRCLQ